MIKIPLNNKNNNSFIRINSRKASVNLFTRKLKTKQTRTHKQRQDLGNIHHLETDSVNGATLTAMMK